MCDGKGPTRSSIRIGSMRVVSSPSWAMTISAVNVPINVADEEWPTMKAIVASYHENGQVIGEMGRAAVAEIHREGTAANARAQSTANDAAADAHRDELSRSSNFF